MYLQLHKFLQYLSIHLQNQEQFEELRSVVRSFHNMHQGVQHKLNHLHTQHLDFSVSALNMKTAGMTLMVIVLIQR
jgi:hypothetical protein